MAAFSRDTLQHIHWHIHTYNIVNQSFNQAIDQSCDYLNVIALYWINTQTVLKNNLKQLEQLRCDERSIRVLYVKSRHTI